MMNAIFEDEIREGWLTVYMDDMLIATDDDPALHKRYVHRILDKLGETTTCTLNRKNACLLNAASNS